MQPSGTAAVFDAVARLRAAGQEVLSLSLGEPDFPTPVHIREAAKRALDQGATRYTQVAGIPSLREAICADSTARRGVTHGIDQVVVTAGAKHALFNLAQVLFDPGDRVVIPIPCWGSYVEQARLCGAEPVLLPTLAADGFLPTPDALSDALSGGAKAVVLCAPSNPTGALVTESDWRAIAEVLRGVDAYVVLDEIYGRLTYDGLDDVSLLRVAPDLQDRVVVVDGVSKTFAMTGFRIGWALAPAPVARAMVAIQSQATTNVATMAQWAAQAALTGDQTCVAEMVAVFEARRDLLCAGLENIPGLRVPVRPQGAFYVFVDAHAWLSDKVPDDVALAHQLLDRTRVAVVPGSAFHAPGYLRFSYATSTETLEEALSRLAQLAGSWSPH